MKHQPNYIIQFSDIDGRTGYVAYIANGHIESTKDKDKACHFRSESDVDNAYNSIYDCGADRGKEFSTILC